MGESFSLLSTFTIHPPTKYDVYKIQPLKIFNGKIFSLTHLTTELSYHMSDKGYWSTVEVSY